MSPVLAYHAAPRRCRSSITRYGLLPNLPSAANWFGVYVYRDDQYDHTWRMRRDGTVRLFHLRWRPQPSEDVWEVAYIGPMCNDPFVENGFVLFGPVRFISLVSHLSRVTFSG